MSAEQIYGGKPFAQAINAFRQKINIPTKRWDDLMGEMHGKGFMVAGAMKADLLNDLRGAVDKAISEGKSLGAFRKEFDGIVERYGWVYKGNRNWRTKVIYGTNLRTAHAAGRYRQMTDPDVIDSRPYWQYRHGDSQNPRDHHLALDGMILMHDDPFWNSHYPPNGWGCRCFVVTLGPRDMKRLGKDGPDTAPEIEYREWTDRDGTVRQVPKGIDPGWDHNPGKAADRSYQVLADKFETLPYEIARPWMDEFLAGPAFSMFYSGRVKGEFPVAVLSEADKAALGTRAQTVWLSDTTLSEHRRRHPEIGIMDYRNIPEIIETGEVYKQGKDRLIYLKKDDRLYRAALKRTKDRAENYYLSLFTTREDQADWQVRDRYERIR